jgi:hypothetical protein
MAAVGAKDEVIGLQLVDSCRFWVLRFRLMVKRGPLSRPQASEGEAQHGHFAGLDVSVKETSVCIVDETGRIVREVKVASEPDALLPVLMNCAYHFKRIDWKLATRRTATMPAGLRR